MTTPYGQAKVKVCLLEGKEMHYPEYESVKKLAKEQGMAYGDAYQMVKEQIMD